MKFRKKPVVIDAFQMRGRHDAPMPAPIWFVDALVAHRVRLDEQGEGGAVIQTLEGEMRANVGDWVVCGIKGEIYPVKPDIFAATYEPAE